MLNLGDQVLILTEHISKVKMSLMFISAIYGIILVRGLAEHRFLNCIEFIARKTGASILQLVWDFFVVVSGIVNFLFL